MANVLQKPVNFIREVKAELGKVSWSSRRELLGSTMVVIVITLLMALFIGIVDWGLAALLRRIFAQ
jgi:preprotein translocase subunit SecE